MSVLEAKWYPEVEREMNLNTHEAALKLFGTQRFELNCPIDGCLNSDSGNRSFPEVGSRKVGTHSRRGEVCLLLKYIVFGFNAWVCKFSKALCW